MASARRASKSCACSGFALGVGVKRNVLNLYKFLCRNYKAGDHIWAFGFSRGAFTVRVLVGLIHREGLVSFNSEAELARNALAAYRAYRRKAFSTYIPWVLVGRMVRDLAVSIWNTITGGRSYAEVEKETAGLAATPSKSISLGSGTPSSPTACRSTSSRGRSTNGSGR